MTIEEAAKRIALAIGDPKPPSGGEYADDARVSVNLRYSDIRALRDAVAGKPPPATDE